MLVVCPSLENYSLTSEAKWPIIFSTYSFLIDFYTFCPIHMNRYCLNIQHTHKSTYIGAHAGAPTLHLNIQRGGINMCVCTRNRSEDLII